MAQAHNLVEFQSVNQDLAHDQRKRDDYAACKEHHLTERHKFANIARAGGIFEFGHQ
jgi:hypothetical protein